MLKSRLSIHSFSSPSSLESLNERVVELNSGLNLWILSPFLFLSGKQRGIILNYSPVRSHSSIAFSSLLKDCNRRKTQQERIPLHLYYLTGLNCKHYRVILLPELLNLQFVNYLSLSGTIQRLIFSPLPAYSTSTLFLLELARAHWLLSFLFFDFWNSKLRLNSLFVSQIELKHSLGK